MNSSGKFKHSPPKASPTVKRQRLREIDLWLDLLPFLTTKAQPLEVEELAEYLEVSPTAVYQYQSSGVAKLRSVASSRGLTVNDVRRGLRDMGVEL